MTMLDEAAVPYRIILTKADKKAKGVVQAVEDKIKKHGAAYPYVHLTSANKGDGIPELRAIIAGFAS